VVPRDRVTRDAFNHKTGLDTLHVANGQARVRAIPFRYQIYPLTDVGTPIRIALQ
jgi:hypothetical protein